jgi:hypothetical protein
MKIAMEIRIKLIGTSIAVPIVESVIELINNDCKQIVTF